MAFFTKNSGFFMIMLIGLVLVAPGFSQTLPNPPFSSPSLSTKGSDVAEPNNGLGASLCALQCGAQCAIFSTAETSDEVPKPNFFGFPIGDIYCIASCLSRCTHRTYIKPDLYRCTLGCAFNSAATTTLTNSGEEADRNKRMKAYLGSCYNKCEKNHKD